VTTKHRLTAALATAAAAVTIAVAPAPPASAHQVTDGPDSCLSGGWKMSRWVTWGHYTYFDGVVGVQIMGVKLQSQGAPIDYRIWIGDSYNNLAWDTGIRHSSSGTVFVTDGAVPDINATGPYPVKVYAAARRGGHPFCNVTPSYDTAYAH